jgi:hypothetical protein
MVLSSSGERLSHLTGAIREVPEHTTWKIA